MNISIYALHLSFGGVEKYVSTLANMLCEHHSVEIISTYKIDDAPAFLLDERVKVKYLLPKELSPNKDELKAAIRSKNIPAIFREVFKSIRILISKKNANIKSIKACDSDVIISTRVFHNSLIAKYAKKAIKITGEHNHHNNDHKYIKSVIDSCKGFDYFIPISRELCDYYRAPMADNGVKTEYIKFCIDDNPNYSAPSFDFPDLINVGRLSPEKGQLDLVEVFGRVVKVHPSARLHIVGDGPDLEKIKALIKEKELSDSVILHGYQNKEYIYNLLPKTSLYVMTSFTESFGLVLLEAMSCGIPCISFSSAQGCHEIIDNGKNGYIIENRDIEAMAEAVCGLISDKEKLRAMSSEALSTADEFSYEKTKNSWLDLMNTIEKDIQE